MSIDDEPPSDEPRQEHELPDELETLKALNDELTKAVEGAANPESRVDLATKLQWVRERMDDLSTGTAGPQRPEAEPEPTVYGYQPAPPVGDRQGSGPPPVAQHPAIDPHLAYYLPPVTPDPTEAHLPANDGRRVVSGSRAGRVDPQDSIWRRRPWLPMVIGFLVGVLLAAIVGVQLLSDDDDTGEVDAALVGTTPASPEDADVIGEVRSLLDSMGFPTVVVEARDGSIALVGSVATEANRQAVIGATSRLTGGLPFDSSALTVNSAGATATPATVDPTSAAAAMQRELERILAVTPIIFDEAQVGVTERHQLVLNNVITTMQAYPDQSVTIVGYTDHQGSPEANERLSRERAANVRDYLLAQGIAPTRLDVRAAGEVEATGADSRGLLERRVEFVVAGTTAAVPASTGIRVGLVGPSASNDLAFTQSMVDALNLLAGERGIEVSVTDSTFVESDAEEALRGYAEDGYDLVISHGSQFAAVVQRLAAEFPTVAFAWGPGFETFGFANVYPYDARAQEGGYVLGAIASLLTDSASLGVVGAIETGDGVLYIEGFKAGALAERAETDILVEYTGSFSDIGLAKTAATGHIDAGADVLTGSAQMVVGAVDAAAARGVLWFGTQANQTSLAPGIVVASQVYHWEVVLRPILDDIAAGRLAGESQSITLANRGLLIEYNGGYALPPEIRQRADELVTAISSGETVPPDG